MATLCEVNQKCLTMKLEFLEEQRGLMHNVVDDYVNKAISAGKQWTQIKTAQRPQFLEIFQKIDSAVEFLCLKHKEFLESDKYSLQTNTEDVATKQNDADVKSEQVLSQKPDVDTTSKTPYQMLAHRLQPIEQFRHILNARLNVKNENATKLQEVMKEVTAMTLRIATLEKLMSQPVVGFSAVKLSAQIYKGYTACVIKDYDNLYYEGSYFNNDTGVFTAPLDGVYVVNVKVTSNEDHVFELILKQLCDSVVLYRFVTHTSDFDLLQMKSGDTLYTEISKCSSRDTMVFVNFSCFMIAECKSDRPSKPIMDFTELNKMLKKSRKVLN